MKTELLRTLIFLPLVLLAGCGPLYENNPEDRFQQEVPKSRFYQEMGRSIHFVEIEPKKNGLIIFIHGTPGSWLAFSVYLADPELSDKTTMIAVDRPGFGTSGPGNLELSLSRQAALFRPLLDRYPARCGAILVGHSLGAPIAARMAME